MVFLPPPPLVRQLGDCTWRHGLIDMVRHKKTEWPIGTTGRWHYRLYYCDATDQYFQITEIKQHGRTTLVARCLYILKDL